ILAFSADAKLSFSHFAYAYICIAPKLTFLHVAIRDPGLGKHEPYGVQECDRLVCRSENRFGDNLSQGGASSVIVDKGYCACMRQLPGVFFQMNPGKLNTLVFAHNGAIWTR